MKSWTDPASSFPWVKPGTRIVVHIRTLKQALTHELVLQIVHTVIKFNQKAWLKEYIAMITHDFEKDSFKLMNYAVFQKLMANEENPKISSS